ncbi:hypothetical protein Rsub_03501 [Raphidocelis subcapitata]|uniref:MYND-type domain-containing protein n=1 Tax=Raphidocelis subcapitata TaxID=307507 RepID=A0A2V0P097_9CHLO|nr:hypothetical protein Rsub_03501 [Raphidocelis subcapitata]|eukprot:GBF90505.1 hypothetical protein Rsub_03501 [Raphidocelis subcapitata]
MRGARSVAPQPGCCWHLIGGEEVVFLYGDSDAVSAVHEGADSPVQASHTTEVAAQINGKSGVLRARIGGGGVPAPTMVRSVAAALGLPTRPLGGGGARSLLGGAPYPLELVTAPVTIRLLCGPGAAPLEWDAPLVLVVPDENRCTDWELQLGHMFRAEFGACETYEWMTVRAPGAAAAAGAAAPGTPAPGIVPYIAPRRGAQITLGTSTFVVADDTMAEAWRAAAEVAAEAARARASAGTRLVGRGACANCGAARGAPGIDLRGCVGCQGVLDVYYCGRECQRASWRSGHRAACQRAQAARGH